MAEENVSEELEQLVQLSLLYDFYGALLKENNREIFEDYILNDMSLGEISSERGITRQGVYDVVKRCRNQLTGYEEKLHLLEKFRWTKEKLKDIDDIVQSIEEEKQAEAIKTITKEIYDII